MKAYVRKSIMIPQNGFRKLDKPLQCVCAVVQYMSCGFVCLSVNCFSSCFIMAQGESRRQRTFLELRLQTVSLVSNLLAPITSNVQTYSCSESWRDRETQQQRGR